MNSLALDDDLVTTIIDIAKSENKPLNQLVREFIDNYLEEKLERELIKEADQTLERTRNGKEMVFTWKEAREQLYEMDCNSRS
jgi:hypothetical protein